MSNATRVTLLKRLSGGDDRAWADFDALYRPLLRYWLRNYLLSEADVEDLIQEVVLFVINNIEDFRHNDRLGSFRKWLRLATVNIARNYLRKHGKERVTGATEFTALLDGLADSNSSLSHAFDLDQQRQQLRYLLNEVNGLFQHKTIDIFRMHVLEGVSAAKTATRQGVSPAAVYIAKSRVLQRLRELGTACWGEEFAGV